MKKTATILLLALVAALSGYAARIDTVTVSSQLLPTPEKITVAVPDAAINEPARRFPTVYLLNGYDGDHSSWIKGVPRLAEMADRYGMVLVMPDGRDSWYFDSPANPAVKMESFITRELVPYIDKRFPTIADPKKRAITGLSMGGHGALWLAMRHPDIFGSAGSTSGGLDFTPFPKSWKLPEILGPNKSNADVWASHTVKSLVPTLQPGSLNIIIDCGTDDFFAKVNDEVHRALLDAGISHDYISRPGKHSWDYWRNSVLYHLLYFNEIFRK